MPPIKILFTLLFLVLLSLGGLTERIESQTSSNPANNFQLLGGATGVGPVAATVFAPAATASKYRIYAGIKYTSGDHFDILAIDPNTGNTQVIPSPVASEYGINAMTVGPDGNVYVGTVPNAHIMKLNVAAGTLVDLGMPVSSETYIYSLTFGSDNRLYGGTYPNCHLVRYDPASGALADLGRVDPVQQYAYSIASGSDGYIYVGVGPATANIAAYQISTGTIQEILPSSAQAAVFPNVYVGTDGNPYATVNSLDFKLSQGAATQITSSQLVQAQSPSLMPDGRWLNFVNTISAGTSVLQMQVLNPTTQVTTTTQIPYQGQPLSIMALGTGPDGNLYGSTLLPANLFRFNTSQDSLSYIGNVGSGEVYSFLSRGNSLLMGAYYALAPLMAYQPAATFATSGNSPNPQATTFAGADPSLRPWAMVEGSDANVYVGAGAKYGALDSPLIDWNPDTSAVTLYDVVPNQSTASLVSWQNLVIGGTTINGGSGTTPTATSAVLFGWNTAGHVAQFTVTPVSGAKTITDLVLAPNGLIYGFADKTLFEFNPATQQITRTQAVSFNPILNGASVDESGRIWGVAQQGIFLVDTNSFTQALFTSSPTLITGGFAKWGNTIYYVAGTSVYSYIVPTTVPTMSVVPAATTLPRSSTNQVTVTVAGTIGTPTGTVTLTGNGLASQTGTLSSGTYTFSIGAWLQAGTLTFSVAYSGDGNYLPQSGSASATITNPTATPTVSVVTSATTLSSSSVPVTVKLTGTSGVPTGTVTISGNFTSQTATLSGGSVSFTIPPGLAAGSQTIQASYAGDTVYLPAWGSAQVTVANANSQLSVVAPTGTVLISSPVPITVTVKGAAGTTPTGTVSMTGTPSNFGTISGTLSSGTATLTIPAWWIAAGTETLSISYGGDINYLGASATTQVTIANPTATPTLSLVPSATTLLSSASLPVSVKLTGSSGVPTGTVTISGNGFTSQTATLSGGSASFVIPSGLPLGSETITASYSGDTVYVKTNASVQVNILSATPQLSVVAPAGTVLISSPVPVTITVKGAGPTPTGTVSMTGTPTNFGTISGTLSSGTATLTIPAWWIAAGTETLSISYGGDGNYTPASATTQVTIANPTATPTLSLVPSATTLLSSASLPVSVKLTGSSGVPTGTVTISGNGIASQTATLSGGSASFVIPSGLPVGSDTITASYSGDTVYVKTNASAQVNVVSATPQLSVVPSATTFSHTSALQVTVTVKGGAGIVPTGTVSMTGTPSSIGTISGTLSSGTVTLTIPAWWLPVGTETLSFSYSGDGNYTPASATTQVTAN